jgi:hypothetical protein
MIAGKLTRRLFLQLAFAASATGLVPALASCKRKCSHDSLNITPRSDWQAADPNLDASGEHGLYDPTTNPEGWLVYDRPLSQVLTTIIVHHSALPPSDGPLEIQSMHMRRRGFADIAYHFVIDDAGQIYEGRALEVRGAHTGGHNTGTLGIVLLGNFEETFPTEAQLAALRTLVGCLSEEFAITHLAGHKDFQPGATVCPGRNLAPLLPGLAADLHLEYGTGGYRGP